MPTPEWLIEPIMPAGGLVGLYGPPGVGKSFIAIDMALSVASGRPWQGHVTRQGFVLYIAAEGGTGITKRVAAWLKTRVIPASQLAAAWLMEAIPVYNDSTDLERVLERVETEIQTKPTLVVVDTLARCFDGNENEQLDMGRFIKGIDRMRHDFDATVMVVHHTRLDGDRERGNTAFRGAADAMLSVSRGHGGTMILSCNKQKDAEEFGDEGFNLTSVAGTDSCVVTVDTRKAKKAQKTSEIIHILRTQGPLTWDAWYQFAQSHGVSKATFARHVHELRETNQILKEKGQWRVFSDDLVSSGNDE
jgi:hypothetical protein